MRAAGGMFVSVLTAIPGMCHFLSLHTMCAPPETVSSLEDDGLSKFKTDGFESRVFEQLFLFLFFNFQINSPKPNELGMVAITSLYR